ncbi:Sphingosine N-acyltransferase lag1 [Dipsacomyces acuminosporus]|nr:Sphingosine N-acyltransferase lag1 [Dipsacomyces acuminosporus]
MPPLEKRHPHIVANAGTPFGRRSSSLPSEADELGMDMKFNGHTGTTPARRRRIHRHDRQPSPNGGLRQEGEAVGVDGAPVKRSSRRKNMILNTRNPFIIWLANNELQVSFSILAIIHGCYWVGFEWPSLWICMQHLAAIADGEKSEASKYVRGIHDFKFVFYWVIQIIALRSVTIHHIMPSIPRYFGITNSRKQRRFSEMGWSLVYIITTWCIGFKVWQQSPYYMNTRNLYTNYPDEHLLMPYGLKRFYLVQTAFWLSNIYTIHIEERRKDHYEMLTHHVATIALVLLSYTFHFTRFGHVFMLVMDFPDIFLSSAKLFRYLNQEVLPNILFGLFTITWVITKHYLCLKMMVSIWTQGPSAIPVERRFPHYPNSYASYPIVFLLWGFLCILQAVLVYWFYLILSVLYKILVKGQSADDNRSDDEDELDGDVTDSSSSSSGSDIQKSG